MSCYVRHDEWHVEKSMVFYLTDPQTMTLLLTQVPNVLPTSWQLPFYNTIDVACLSSKNTYFYSKIELFEIH